MTDGVRPERDASQNRDSATERAEWVESASYALEATIAAMQCALSAPGDEIAALARCLRDDADLLDAIAVTAPTARGSRFLARITKLVERKVAEYDEGRS